MFNHKLFALLGSPSSQLSPHAVKFFCLLIGSVDLRQPRSLEVGLLIRRYELVEGGNNPWISGLIGELVEAGVLEEVGKIHQRRRTRWHHAGPVTGGQGVRGLYRVKPEWWLRPRELGEMHEAQEAQLERESVISSYP